MISVVMRQPHRLLIPEVHRRNQHAENPIGRLFLLGVIDADDLAAAAIFRRLCVDYHRTIGAPKGLVSNADLEKIRSFGTPVATIEQDEKKARDRWHGVKARYDEVTEAVKAVSGKFYPAFVRLVVEDVSEEIDDRVLRACLGRVSRVTSR